MNIWFAVLNAFHNKDKEVNIKCDADEDNDLIASMYVGFAFVGYLICFSVLAILVLTLLISNIWMSGPITTSYLLFVVIPPILLILIDVFIRFHVRLVTDGEKEYRLLYELTIPNDRKTKEKTDRRGDIKYGTFIWFSPVNITVKESPFRIASCIIQPLNFYIATAIWIYVMFPFVMTCITAPIAVYVGFIWVCKKLYRLNKKLKEHINDPDAHNLSENQDT